MKKGILLCGVAIVLLATVSLFIACDLSPEEKNGPSFTSGTVIALITDKEKCII